MKSYQVKNTKPATSLKQGTTTSQYQSKTTSQSGRSAVPTTYINKRQSAQSNKPNNSSNLQKNDQKPKYQIQPQSRTMNKPNTNVNTNNRRAYVPNNLPKNQQKQNYQNNRGERVGATETKVETKQEGDYIIKVTTTRKVIDKGTSGYGTSGSYGRGAK